jgi:hypothetical protein
MLVSDAEDLRRMADEPGGVQLIVISGEPSQVTEISDSVQSCVLTFFLDPALLNDEPLSQ